MLIKLTTHESVRYDYGIGSLVYWLVKIWNNNKISTFLDSDCFGFRLFRIQVVCKEKAFKFHFIFKQDFFSKVDIKSTVVMILLKLTKRFDKTIKILIKILKRTSSSLLRPRFITFLLSLHSFPLSLLSWFLSQTLVLSLKMSYLCSLFFSYCFI